MDKKRIGALLKAARENAYMKQEDAAKLIGSTFQKISSFETGRTRISVETLVQLCQIYNVDLHDILNVRENSDRSLRLKKEEIELIRKYRQLPNDTKKDIRNYIERNFTKAVSYIEGVEGRSSDPVITESARDLHGRTVVFATSVDPLLWRNSASSDDEIRSRTRAFEEIENDYHCKIDMRALNMKTYIKNIAETRAAGRHLADIYYLGGENHILARNGFLAPLQNLQALNFGKNEWDPVNTRIASYKGDVFGASASFVPGFCLYFNKSLARKYIPFDLYEAVRAGEWTFGTFQRVSQQVYYNSSKAVRPLTSDFSMGIADAIYANGTSPIAVRGDRYVFNGADIRLLNALSFCQSYIRSGLYDLTDIRAGVMRGRDAFINGNAMFYHSGIISSPALSSVMNGNFGILPFPKGPDTTEYFSLVGNSRYFSLDANTPEPEDTGALLAAIARRTATPFEAFFKQQALCLQDDGSLDILRRLKESRQMLLINGYCSEFADQIFDNYVVNNVLSLRMSPSFAMKALTNRAQACIDRHFDQ